MIARTGAAVAVGTASVLAALSGAAPAWARDQAIVDVQAGVAAGTNPVLAPGSGTSAASGFVEVRPLLVREDEVSTISLRGAARFEQYSRRYGSDESAFLDLDVIRKETAQLTLRAGLTLRTDKSSARDILAAREFGIAPLPGLGQQLGDVTFIGRRIRTTSGSARIGATYALNELESLDGDLSIRANRFNDASFADYRIINQEVAYGRALSERTRVGAILRVGQVNYFGRNSGDSLILAPLASLTRQFSEGTQATLAVGLSLTRVRLPDGSHDSRTGLALRGGLCSAQVRGRLCVDLNRSSEPTALGDVRTLTSLQATATRNLSQRDTLLLVASASRTSEGGGSLRATRVDFAAASAELARQFDPRLTLFGRASFSDIYDRTVPRRADLRGEIGLRYRFGAIR